MGNDTRILRERVISATDALDIAQGAAETYANPAAIVVTTTVDTYPTTANVMYAVIEQIVTGSEDEGATPTVGAASGANPFYALNVGTQIPDSGTKLVVHQVGGRWVFRYDTPPS